MTASASAPGRRECGACTLCCRLLPVRELRKGANVRCEHQRFRKGCAIYDARPMACRIWTCRWLSDPRTAGMPRPDRSHYVIDVMPDKITIVPHDGTPPWTVPVIQIWADPAYPRAHDAPELLAYLTQMNEKDGGCAAIVRWSATEATTLIPRPPGADGPEWLEIESNMRPPRSAPREAQQGAP